MSSHQKAFKLTVVAIIACLLGILLVKNVAIDQKNGIRLRGDIEMSWQKPADTRGHMPPGDLTGYTIHCWNAADRTSKTIVIEDPAATSYSLNRLWPGDYQCAMSAMLADGSQSALSNVVTRSVP